MVASQGRISRYATLLVGESQFQNCTVWLTSKDSALHLAVRQQRSFHIFLTLDVLHFLNSCLLLIPFPQTFDKCGELLNGLVGHVQIDPETFDGLQSVNHTLPSSLLQLFFPLMSIGQSLWNLTYKKETVVLKLVALIVE
jgi:hypothetical protein